MHDKKARLSVLIDLNEHKLLKMCCAEIGVSITEFVLDAVGEAIDLYLYQKEFKELTRDDGVDKQTSL